MKDHFKNKFSSIDAIIHFGSRIISHDIDLLIITNDEQSEDGARLFFTIPPNIKFDCIQIASRYIIPKLTMLDIAFYEPILTGSLLYGNNHVFNQLYSIAESALPSDNTAKYLYNQGVLNLIDAEFYFHLHKRHIAKTLISENSQMSDILDRFNEKIKFPTEYAGWALVTLSTSCSYFILYKIYTGSHKHIKPILFKELLRRNDSKILKQIVASIKLLKMNEEDLSQCHVDQLISDVKKS